LEHRDADRLRMKKKQSVGFVEARWQQQQYRDPGHDSANSKRGRSVRGARERDNEQPDAIRKGQEIASSRSGIRPGAIVSLWRSSESPEETVCGPKLVEDDESSLKKNASEAERLRQRHTGVIFPVVNARSVPRVHQAPVGMVRITGRSVLWLFFSILLLILGVLVGAVFVMILIVMQF
jgi:hypothetical protein